MRQRAFTDRKGVRWTVSEVIDDAPAPAETRERRANARSKQRPSADAPRLSTRPLGLPWLSFDSRNERRRISSVPAGWEDLPDDELQDLLGESEAV